VIDELTDTLVIDSVPHLRQDPLPWHPDGRRAQGPATRGGQSEAVPDRRHHRGRARLPGADLEIVHGGYAFLEETALQYALFQNIVVNLEGTSLFLTHAKRKFAEILGTLIASGGPQRVVWATGAALFHPQPLLEEFWNLEMPRDLVEGYGFPQLTSEMKQAILGGNQARILRA
jgi:hypothetical protein